MAVLHSSTSRRTADYKKDQKWTELITRNTNEDAEIISKSAETGCGTRNKQEKYRAGLRNLKTAQFPRGIPNIRLNSAGFRNVERMQKVGREMRNAECGFVTVENKSCVVIVTDNIYMFTVV